MKPAAVLRDLAAVGVEIVTIGQYLRPSGEQLPVARFYSPEEFAALKQLRRKRRDSPRRIRAARPQLLPRARADTKPYRVIR